MLITKARWAAQHLLTSSVEGPPTPAEMWQQYPTRRPPAAVLGYSASHKPEMTCICCGPGHPSTPAELARALNTITTSVPAAPSGVLIIGIFLHLLSRVDPHKMQPVILVPDAYSHLQSWTIQSYTSEPSPDLYSHGVSTHN